MSRGKAYIIGLILVLVTWRHLYTSFIAAVIFTVGFGMILYGYGDMIHKDKDPFKYL